MRFHAPSVSASADGDYYQLSLGPEDSGDERADPHEVRGPYLIVQRDFEMPCGECCYLESDDERYVVHFALRLTEISPTRLAFEIPRKTDNRVEVSYGR